MVLRNDNCENRQTQKLQSLAVTHSKIVKIDRNFRNKFI